MCPFEESANAGRILTMNDLTDITIIGASARAACWSAVRAELRVCAFDRFGDLDFPAGCDVHLICPSERLFPELDKFRETQHRFCLPVGGWENDAELMQFVESNFSLWNTNSTASKLARNPFLIQQILREANLPDLEVRDADGNKKAGKWIRKPLAGTGGIGIERVLFANGKSESNYYDQQFVQGKSYSAVFFASQDDEIKLLGITQQLIGCEELPHRPFAYVGSVGPVLSGDNENEKSIRLTLQKMADALSKQIQFYGLFCFDFVVSLNVPYLVEINPRYSASVEVLELALQESFLQLFLNRGVRCNAPERQIGKSILYAWQEFELPSDWDWNQATHELAGRNREYDQWNVPVLSDLPAPGTRFSTGDPVCTIWAEQEEMKSCCEELIKRNLRLKRIMQALE